MKFSRESFKGLYQLRKWFLEETKFHDFPMAWFGTLFTFPQGMGTSFWNVITWSKHWVEPRVACFIQHSGLFWEERKRNKNGLGRILQELELHLHFICFKNKDIYYITKEHRAKVAKSRDLTNLGGKGNCVLFTENTRTLRKTVEFI